MASVRSALVTVYAGYFFRYLYLLILIPFYSRVLGPDEYGRVLAAMSLYSFVWVFQNWGFSVVGARNIANAHTEEERALEFGRHMRGRLLLMPIALLIGIGGTFWSPLLREVPLFGLFATLCGVMAGFNLGWYFQGVMQFRVSILVEILGFAISLPMILLLVSGPKDSIWVLAALFASGLASCTFAYVAASRSVKIGLSPTGTGIDLLKESSPMFIAAGASSLLANGGTYSLSLMSTPSQVAFYGTAERVVTTVLGLLGPAGQVMLAWFSKMGSDGTTEGEMKQRQKKAVIWVCSAGMMAFIGAATFVPPMLVWFLGDKFEHAGSVMRAFSPIFLLSAFNHAMVVYVLLPARLDRKISYVGVSVAIFGGILMVIAAHYQGAVGIALSRVAAEFFSALLLIWAYKSSTRPAGKH